MSRRWLPVILIPMLTLSLLALFDYFAPLEPASVSVYAGWCLVLTGLVSLIVPLQFFAIRTRRSGVVVGLLGLAVLCCGLFWPVRSTRVAQRQTILDEVMPECEFSERHLARVHAPPERVSAALRETTFSELRVYDTLMRIRALASGRVVRGRNGIGDQKILEAMARPGSGFVPLREEGGEIVMGMAGRPWSNSQGAPVRTAAEFDAFQVPHAIKVAFNLRVEDAGPGWSQMTTETRIRATDAAAGRTMARYWRLIYPGSGMIRRMWLNAVRERAERT